MTTVNVHEAKTRLSQLLREVEAGGEVIIARDGKPVARLAPVTQDAPARRFGAMKGRIAVGDAFLEPLPEDELARWE